MKIVYLFVGWILISMTVSSQTLDDVVEKDSSSNAWIQFASGPAYYHGGDDAASFFLSFNKRWNQDLMIIRLAGFSEFFTGYSDFGIMYGYLITEPNAKRHVSVSMGISYITAHGTSFGLFGGRSGSYTYYKGMGVPYQVTASWKLGKYWGFGANWIGNLNRETILNGVTVGFQLGDLK